MCGRTRCTLRAEDIPRACCVDGASVRTVDVNRYRPSFNVSPGSDLPVVRRDEACGGESEGAVLHCMKWGLVPSFTKKTEKPDHYRMFNARSESICEKASFRRLVPNNRCLVVVEGFYEWKKDGPKKQPYYIHFKNDQPLVIAALYDSWRNSEGEMLYTFTILTTCSSSNLQWLHDRMPVILGNKESIDAWLKGSTSKSESVLKPYEDPDLVWYPVTPAMGKPSFDGPECIKEIQLKSEEKSSISKFFSKKKGDDEQKLDSQVKVSSEESAQTRPLEEFEVKPPFEEKTELPSDSNMDTGPKSNVSSLPKGEAEKCGIKRYYQEFAGNSMPAIGNIDKLQTSPIRKKKEILNNTGDKQATLFSYFGKS
ncbi:PREDICTED: uncharacterized protein LOC104587981 [Nelumbo nucifera]|uniref:Embryonic stem cell-specific 5-hydroxymethylcytosine-binding protein n=2 Tax=Nelumbo nucifera TaxID=4432 RepID=A0A822XZI1_NELNU|nr:PREDICTED: uncharacterized protein LOC104587981 [Nelumbo nucifera]DAD24215.1 TPA_asm: hypothetical protein HUJ06_025678 [Nelumbo nucifera]